MITDKQKKILLELSKEGLLFHCPQFCAPDSLNELQCQYCKSNKIITRCLSSEEEQELIEMTKGPYDESKYRAFEEKYPWSKK